MDQRFSDKAGAHCRQTQPPRSEGPEGAAPAFCSPRPPHLLQPAVCPALPLIGGWPRRSIPFHTCKNDILVSKHPAFLQNVLRFPLAPGVLPRPPRLLLSPLTVATVLRPPGHPSKHWTHRKSPHFPVGDKPRSSGSRPWGAATSGELGAVASHELQTRRLRFTSS